MAKTRYARSLDEVIPLIQSAEESAKLGHWTVLAVSFEAAAAFDTKHRVHASGRSWLAASQSYDHKPNVVSNPPPLLKSAPNFEPQINKEQFLTQIAKIKEHIQAGDTYQVNFTFPLTASTNGVDPRALFDLLCAPESPPYARFLEFEDSTILCLSPELFFRYEQLGGEKHITCRPMKGTRAWNHTSVANTSLELQTSEKDRAENLMIVDMVRNDLGRIAIPGSIKVLSLFDIETYPTVLQMTSTVECRTLVSLTGIFTALFPCASIVGAPKIETLKIINDSEPEPRGLYTGAIGLVGPGFAEFGVAIRTMEIVKDRATYCVGSGIVWDSQPEEEWEECLTKAKILCPFGEGLQLVETMFFDGDIYLLDRHLRRLRSSCDLFGIEFDESSIRLALGALPTETSRVRITLDVSGRVSVTTMTLSASPNLEPSVAATLKVKLSERVQRSDNLWLQHKTTYRPHYEPDPTFDDILHFNEHGHLTEFGLGNLVIEKEDGFITPPFQDGLLRGVFREEMIENGTLTVAHLTKHDLMNSQAAYRINSVRGWEKVEF